MAPRVRLVFQLAATAVLSVLSSPMIWAESTERLRLSIPAMDGAVRTIEAPLDHLVWFGRHMNLEDVPDQAAESLRRLGKLGEDRLPVKLSILVFEIETEGRPGFETERFVDSLGRTLFEFEKPVTEHDEDRPLSSLQELTVAARQTVLEFVGKAPLTRLQLEKDWGHELVAAKWRGQGFEHELKLLPSGAPLFLEIETPDPLPLAVESQLGGRPYGELEAMLLYAIGSLDKQRVTIDGLVLPDGKVLLQDERLEFAQRVREDGQPE